MQKVIIISTEHVESGKCNSNELLKIIESIKPEVIFEEEPNDAKYHSYYIDQKSFKTLEIHTIIKYKLNHNIVNIPVDKPINEFVSILLLDNLTKIFNRFHDHNNLVKEHCYLRDNYGFNYLNSKECSELNEKKILIEKDIISINDNEKNELINLYNQFHQEVDARDTKMIENIYEFSKSNKFEKAVFFLGYAHRESIRKKLSELKKLYENQITWSFYNE
jgi:hypothetical protein